MSTSKKKTPQAAEGRHNDAAPDKLLMVTQMLYKILAKLMKSTHEDPSTLLKFYKSFESP